MGEVRYEYSPEVDVQVVRAVQRTRDNFAAFAADMYQKGIHVGLGGPPACVICGVWPCQGQDNLHKEGTTEP